MKLLFCQDCGDIVAPNPTARMECWCRCARHAVWWENPFTGILRLHDKTHVPDPEMVKSGSVYAYMPRRPRAYVIGLTNLLLSYDGEGLNAQIVQELIDQHDERYLFRRWRSLVIRIRPGESSDTGWAALPFGERILAGASPEKIAADPDDVEPQAGPDLSEPPGPHLPPVPPGRTQVG